MPAYTTFEDVSVRLVGKVRFTTALDDENRMSVTLAERLIDEAEGQVELDLSPRYLAPFQTDDGDAFNTLPERPTRNILRTLCELMGCIRILETDFGAGTIVDAEKYIEKLRNRYESIVKDLLAKRMDGGVESQGFAKPPLPSLKLNYMNENADDGFMGSVLISGQGDGSYPKTQINDPSENFWNGSLDDL
jgi:phage gp36-like protein